MPAKDARHRIVIHRQIQQASPGELIGVASNV
jgi:hypothetical protein